MRIGGLGISETIKLGETAKIKKAASKTSQNAMTDGFVEHVKEMAKKDAQNGVYMSKEFAQIKQAQKKTYVSPNRSGLQGLVMSFMQRAAAGGNRGTLLVSLLDGYSMKANLGACSQYNTAEVFASNGELVGAYTSGGQWIEMPTEAESSFLSETDSIYLEAYRAARAEMNVSSQVSVEDTTTSVDVRV